METIDIQRLLITLWYLCLGSQRIFFV